MSIDTSAPFTATAEHLIDTVAQARADLATAIRERNEALGQARLERLWRESLEGEISRLMHENRELRKANLSWQERAAALAPTVELPRVQPEPVRRRSRRGRHQ